jgi:hypothetical protein
MTTTQKVYIQEIQSLISGMQKHTPNLALIIASQTYTSVQLMQLMQALITSTSAVLAAKTAWHDAVQGNLKLVAQDGPVIQELRQTVGLMYSNSESVLADFGLLPKKTRTPLTTQQRAARAAKAAATRLARGTTSKKQKEAVTGNVTGVTITPNTAPTAAPAATVSTSVPAVAVGAAPATVPAAPAQPVAAPTNGAVVAAGTSHG